MRPKPYEILMAVEAATGVPPSVILTDNRVARTSYARFLAMLLFAEINPHASNHDAAKFVGKLDPSTGRHGLMRARFLLENDEAFREAHAAAREALKKVKQLFTPRRPRVA